jgi:rubredoxin
MTSCRKWRCQNCTFLYDEALGLPDEGLPAGTPWEDVPDDWLCPDCGSAKSDFAMEPEA